MKLYTAHVDESELFSLLDGLELLYENKLATIAKLDGMSPEDFAEKTAQLQRMVQLRYDLNALSPDEDANREKM